MNASVIRNLHYSKSRSGKSKIVAKYVLEMVRDVESSCFGKIYFWRKIFTSE